MSKNVLEIIFGFIVIAIVFVGFSVLVPILDHNERMKCLDKFSY